MLRKACLGCWLIFLSELLQYSSARSAPLNFLTVASTSISLSWPQWDSETDVGEGPVKEYVIEYREEGGSFMEGERTTTGLTSTISGLKAGTLYEFHIVLVREGTNGEGPPSDIQRQRTLCGGESNKCHIFGIYQ